MTSRCTKTNTQISLSKNPCQHCMKKEEELEEKRGRTWGEKISNWKGKERKGTADVWVVAADCLHAGYYLLSRALNPHESARR